MTETPLHCTGVHYYNLFLESELMWRCYRIWNSIYEQNHVGSFNQTLGSEDQAPVAPTVDPSSSPVAAGRWRLVMDLLEF